MHKSQSLFNLTNALHVSGVTITHLQEHKTTVTTASGICHTVIAICRYRGRDGTGLSCAVGGVRRPQQTHISSNSSTIAADNNTV